MPIHPHLDDVALDIAYQSSPEPQMLDVRAVYAGEAEMPLAAWAIGTWIECVNRGLGGGAELPPTSGSAKLIAGPTGEGAPDPSERASTLAWQLQIAAVSPRFLRVLLESFAASARPHRLVSASIVGSTALGIDSRTAARESVMKQWLEDPAAYPGAWSAPGFKLAQARSPRGATIRVDLSGNARPPIAKELERTISAWQSAILTTPTLAGTGRGLMAPQCTFARTKTSVIARAELFDHARAPARAALSNALAWFHERVAKIASAEIALP